MKSASTHRLAIFAAILGFAVVVLGAIVTSEIRTFPGAPPSTITAPVLEQTHRIAGYLLALTALGVALFASNLAGWLAFGSIVADGLLAGSPVVHALLAPIAFSLLVAAAITTSASWRSGPQPVESSWRPLKTIGLIVPALIFLQVALGSAFRHNAMSTVIWHVLNAFIVLLVALIPGVFILRQDSPQSALRPAALALVIIIGIQVLLGFSVYLVLLMSDSNNMGLIITGILHVANGSLTLAAGIVLTMQMRRNLHQRQQR
jgi:heme A synthase